MIKTSVKTIAISAGTVLFFGVLFLLLNQPQRHVDTVQIAIGKTTITATVADTAVERERGLSGTPSLAATEGKLFLFEVPDKYGFWMKDMNYPIDIIWIDQNNTIVDITRRATPESYPTVFSPRAPVVSVLELAADFSTQYDVSIGDSIRIKK